MTRRSTPTEWFLFLAIGVVWGSSYLFIKLGVETLSPFTLIAARLGIGGVVLAAAVRITGASLPRSPRMYGHLLVMATMNIVLPFFLITWAEQRVDSATAAIINGAVPLAVIVLAAFFLHDEPITVNRAVGLPVGFVGVVLLVAGDLGKGGAEAEGALALLGSTLLYSMGNIYNRRNVRGLHPVIPAFFQVAIAFSITAVLALTLEHPQAEWFTPQAIFSVAWLGILGSAVAYLIYFRLLGAWGATRTSLLAYLLPVVGIVLGVAVRNEPVDTAMLAGTVLIITGIAAANSRRGQRRLYGRGGPQAD